MRTTTVLRLWRVEWVHRNGYRAPYQFVEAKTRKEAIEIQKVSKSSRLADFPEVWSWHLSSTGLIWNDKRNKWIEEHSI